MGLGSRVGLAIWCLGSRVEGLELWRAWGL